MKGTISFDVFKLSNLGLVIGIDWEMIPSLGVQATIDAGDFESSVAVFFNSANPSQSMVAGAVSNITLKNVFDTLTGVSSSAIDSVLSQVGISGTDPFPIPGSLANDLDHLKLEKVAAAFKDKGYTIPTSTQKTLLVVNTPGSVWHLTNLDSESSGHPTHYQLKKKGGDIEVSVEAQFYCAPQDTQISDLFSYKKGFFINGKIHFFFIEAEASVTVSSNKGFAIDADMDPIIIGNATLFSIKAAKGSGGPKISVATFDQPQEPKEFRSPHFFINGQLEMLGIKDSIYVNLTEKSGLKFDLKTQCISGLTFDLSGHFNALDNMEVKGDVDAEIPTIDLGILGKVNLETGAGGSLDLGVNKKDIYAHIKAHFEFAGQTLTLPIIDLDFEIASLEKLVEKLAGLIKNALKDFLDDAVQWAKYVGEKIIEGVEDVEHVLSEYFKKTPKEIKAILKIAASTCPVASATMLM
ncbi:MAG: hypothetical protein GY765_20485 [bacterium]|nr:hypothetical protein [bacterium]